MDRDRAERDPGLEAGGEERATAGVDVGHRVQRLQRVAARVAESHQGAGRGGAGYDADANSVSNAIRAHP